MIKFDNYSCLKTCQITKKTIILDGLIGRLKIIESKVSKFNQFIFSNYIYLNFGLSVKLVFSVLSSILIVVIIEAFIPSYKAFFARIPSIITTPDIEHTVIAVYITKIPNNVPCSKLISNYIPPQRS